MSQFLQVLVITATAITRQQKRKFGVMGEHHSAIGVTDNFKCD